MGFLYVFGEVGWKGRNPGFVAEGFGWFFPKQQKMANKLLIHVYI